MASNLLTLLMLIATVSVISCAKISENDNYSQISRDSELFSKATSFRASRGLQTQENHTENCTRLLEAYDPELTTTIKGYQENVDKIIELVTNGGLKGETYKKLKELVDRYPIRQSGFDNLENAIDFMMEEMKTLGLENVRGEQVLVPHWVRGEEKAELLAPHKKSIRMLGLGTSVGTPEEGIEAPVFVVTSFDDLEKNKDKVKGKIVVYNQIWNETYGATNVYRSQGASKAAEHGAVAALIRSITDFSLHTPHTGGQNYQEGVPQIPAACITMEDAEFLYRLQVSGKDIKIHLKMLDYNLPLTTSRNVIGELPGTTHKTEYVAVSGHIDSWDVGQGAMDDGGGVMISVMALAALKMLNLTTKRTLQTILWTSEEVGLWGVEDFAKQHEDILPNYSVVFESDSGTFRPKGLDFAGSELAGCIVNEVLKLTSKIETTEYARYSSVSSDITKLQAKGVPGLSLNNENDKYFWYHHTEADTMSMIDSEELDYGTALWAATSYVLADLDTKLPRD